ncbi:MAG: hypothetical protein J6W44_03820 [Oscillospiraceae bacterium]|nr:hypothetical protein [Oscillospiraceae bacterium]
MKSDNHDAACHFEIPFRKLPDCLWGHFGVSRKTAIKSFTITTTELCSGFQGIGGSAFPTSKKANLTIALLANLAFLGFLTLPAQAVFIKAESALFHFQV